MRLAHPFLMFLLLIPDFFISEFFIPPLIFTENRQALCCCFSVSINKPCNSHRLPSYQTRIPYRFNNPTESTQSHTMSWRDHSMVDRNLFISRMLNRLNHDLIIQIVKRQTFAETATLLQCSHRIQEAIGPFSSGRWPQIPADCFAITRSKTSNRDNVGTLIGDLDSSSLRRMKLYPHI